MKIIHKKQSDSKLQPFYSKPEIASDVLNAYFFEGKEVIKPNELHPLDTKEGSQRRDIAMLWKTDREEVILCIEIQSVVDSKMPVRIMGYDARRYEKERKLSKKYVPVITLVLYTGERRWGRPSQLKDRVFKGSMDDYVVNYPIYIMDIHDYYPFKSKVLKTVFEQSQWIYGHKDDSEINETIVTYEEAELIFQHTGYELIFKNMKRQEEYRMCELFENLLSKGRQEGEIRGILEGEARGKTLERKLMLDKICQYVKDGLTSEELYQRLLSEQ